MIPVLVAVVPITPWINSGMKEIDPNIAMPIRKPVMAEVLKKRFENRSRGSIGSLALFSVIKKNQKIGRQDPSIKRAVGDLQPFSLPISVSPRSVRVIIEARRMAPL